MTSNVIQKTQDIITPVAKLNMDITYIQGLKYQHYMMYYHIVKTIFKYHISHVLHVVSWGWDALVSVRKYFLRLEP